MFKRILPGLILLFSFSEGWAQHTLCGTVLVNHLAQKGAVVHNLNTGDTVLTNENGHFCFTGLQGGIFYLKAVYDHFSSSILKVLVTDDISGIRLEISPRALKSFTIKGNSQKQERDLHSIRTDIVDLSKEASSSMSVEQLMNQTAGIRVRNSSGLGADADIVVGGFHGKSIKFLIDGIPIDYLGSSMSLTKIPTSAADYIEVYKGVMPTEIGVDALGGAINIVTRKPDKTTHSVSYEGGSFNTHKVSLNSYIKKSDKLSYGINAFANYSDNDFKVDHLPIEDEATGRTNFIRARLFHNGYKQYSAEAFVNIQNRKWTDLLTFKINSYALKRDIQNEFSSRSRPFGKVFQKEEAYLVPSITYKKSFLGKKLHLSQFIVFSRIQHELTDSAKNVSYDWSGQKHATISGNEMGLDFSNLAKPAIEAQLDNLTYRGLFTYRINNNQKLILNLVDNQLVRKADDLNSYHSRNKIHYNRFISGFGYQYALFDNRLEGLSQVKYMHSYIKGTLINDITGKEEIPTQNRGWSFAQSLKYTFYNGWLLRASVENTYRLPDQMEVYGDNMFIKPNLELKPEKSFNINFGARYKHKEKYSLEANAYIRKVRDLIRLKDITQFEAVFLNLDKVHGFGLELEGWYRPVKNLELSGNLTYNEFRFKGSNEQIANEHFINARVSNMPYYFGNATASYFIKEAFSPKANLRLYWTYTYVHQFYLDFIEKQFEPSGFLGLFGKSKIHTNRIIPVQQVHTAGFIWTRSLKKDKDLAFSAEVDDIFNKPIYNNFKMQSAGRSLSAKITYNF